MEQFSRPLGVILILWGMVGCDKELGRIDRDRDGYAAAYDCNDSDPGVNPGADELWGDGVDNDCDHATDCADPDLDVLGEWTGDLGEADVAGFCDGFCSRSVTGSVLLEETALTDLTGLDCLVSVGDQVSNQKNDALVSLSGLEHLESVGGDFTVGFLWCDVDQDGGLVCDYTGNPALT